MPHATEPGPSGPKMSLASVWALVVGSGVLLAIGANTLKNLDWFKPDAAMAAVVHDSRKHAQTLADAGTKIVDALEKPFDADIANNEPTYDELREAIADGKLTRTDARQKKQEATAEFLSKNPAAAAAINSALEQMDRDAVCRGAACDAVTFDRIYARTFCQFDREFRGWITLQRRQTSSYLKDFTDYVDSVGCAEVMKAAAIKN